MSKISEVRRTVAKVVKAGLELPPGIQLVTSEGGLPVFPIANDDGSTAHWLIYVQKQGDGPRPSLVKAAAEKAGVIDLGKNWKLGKIQIPDSEIHFSYKAVFLVNEMAKKLMERDPATEN
jgi:hypothetical protein